MEIKMPKNYNPKEFEEKIYEAWDKSGAFKVDENTTKKTFTIIMPPPNITGQLHMGHTLDHAIQDLIVRYKRMQGFEALWLPGTDHASIATEVKVVQKIFEDEGKTKEDLGRDEFLKRAWDWKELYGNTIINQCRRLGDSCDWDRLRFTMDDGCNEAVKEFFVTLYEKGYIYKGNRIINWCPDCGTSLSDAEVDHHDHQGNYWYFEYKGVDDDVSIVVATSRPETMFADAAIAVNPLDERYKHLVGKKVYIPTTNIEIPIIADEYPDPEKGSGAVKITPAHDPNDFEVGKRHNLPERVCIDFEAKMTDLAGEFEGMDRYECRKLWIKKLEEAGHLVKIENVEIPTGGCYRCNTVVEPMVSEQWFVAMKELAKPALDAVKNKQLKFVPERFTKIYVNWLENIQDWCISRQLWWGHRIPAFYCEDCGHINVSRNVVECCEKCNSKNINQDEDVVDTWFSSALWPFSTMGWPKETEEMKKFFPNTMLVTGYDIIFFWVVRMVFASMAMTGKVPFNTVYIHGLVRDNLGRKMSKSLGNGIDPLEVIDEYGADALRFMLIQSTTSGNDMRFLDDRLLSARNFANKLWNATRFVLMNLQDEKGEFLPMVSPKEIFSAKLKEEDKWIIHQINQGAKNLEDYMENYEFALASSKIEDMIWSLFCDWYIELVKSRLYGEDEEDKKVVRGVLVKSLAELLKLLHPFMPFITEEIWSYLPDSVKTSGNNFLMKEETSIYCEAVNFSYDVKVIEKTIEIIKAIRNIRVEAEAAPSRTLSVDIIGRGDMLDMARASENHIKKIANVRNVNYMEEKPENIEDAMSAAIYGLELFVPLADLIDFSAEIERLSKEREKLIGEVARVEKMLSNPGFVNKAPAEKIQAEKDKKVMYQDMLEKVTSRLADLESKK